MVTIHLHGDEKVDIKRVGVEHPCVRIRIDGMEVFMHRDAIQKYADILQRAAESVHEVEVVR